MKPGAKSIPALPDPERLHACGGRPASLLRAYARWTHPGDAEGVAAWYRLSAALEGPPRAPSPARPRLGIVSGLMILSLGVWLLVRSDAGLPDPVWPAGAGGAYAGQGGAGGAGGAPGVGFSL